MMSDGNGLYYMRARFYSPEIRRFVNRDVLLGDVGDGQSLNRFAFVTGRPVSFVDPFGLSGVFADRAFFEWIGVYFIGRQTEADVQDEIADMVEQGLLPRQQRNSARDAVRHCTAACTLTTKIGRANAETAQNVWEFLGDMYNTTAQDKFMDYHNNGCGFDFAETGATSLKNCANSCMNALNNGTLIRQMDLGDPFWTIFGQRVMERLYLRRER